MGRDFWGKISLPGFLFSPVTEPRNERGYEYFGSIDYHLYCLKMLKWWMLFVCGRI